MTTPSVRFSMMRLVSWIGPMDQAPMSPPRRARPPYLAVVPSDPSGFKHPDVRPLSVPRMRELTDAMATTAAVVERLTQAVHDGDQIVARALAGQAMSEVRNAQCAAKALVLSATP